MKTTSIRKFQVALTFLALLSGAQVLAFASQLPKEDAPTTPVTPKPKPPVATHPATPPVTSTPPVTANPQPPSESAIHSSATPLWEVKSDDGKEWTAHVLHTLDTTGKELLDVIPADAKTFCPNYPKLTYNERKEFWAYLISAMVRSESNFDPKSMYTESFADANGKKVVSRGLLQLSIESSKGYDCGFNTATELYDPKKNLTCGIRILSHWLSRDGRIAGNPGGGWKGGARYWSVLRTTRDSYPKIVASTKATALCQL